MTFNVRHALPIVISWTLDSLGLLAHLLLVCIGLYLLPGLGLVRALWPRAARPLTSAEQFGLGMGVSLVLPPILLYIVRLIGLTWSTSATTLYVLAAAVLCSTTFVRVFARKQRVGVDWGLVGLLLISLGALVIRLFAVRDLRAGFLGDSVHHTMIVQLLLDNNGLFNSWQPYAPLSSFTYHFGFHSNVAFYAWLTGTPATLSTLIVGQAINAATAPMAFLLISRLLRQDQHADATTFPLPTVAGVWAAALTAFASSMPFFYTNWGRYTQLVGQVVLVAVVVVWIEALERAADGQSKRTSPLFGLAILLTVGLMLTHYIVTIFAALMVGTYVIACVVQRANIRAALAVLLPSAVSAFLALVASAPWIRNTLTSGLTRNVTTLGDGAVGADRLALMAALTPITPTYLRPWMLALGGMSVLLALAQRRWRVVMLAIWSALLILVVTPQTFGLPGTGVVDQFTAYIALYITVLPLCAYCVAALLEWIVRPVAAVLTNQRLVASTTLVLTAIAVLGLGIWGASWMPNTIDRNRQMLTAADERAMNWIRANTPADARFVVNTFPAYGGTLIAGTDGGWWIPLLTLRTTTLPPMTYGSERFEREDFYARTNGLATELRGMNLRDARPITVNLTTPENLGRLRAAGVTYVYLGATAVPGPEQVDHIDATALRNSTAFQLVYEADGVRIFQLVQ